MASKNAGDWKGAIEVEYKQLIRRNVYEEVDKLPEGKKAVGVKLC